MRHRNRQEAARRKRESSPINKAAAKRGIYWVDESDRFTIYSMRSGAIIATWWKARSVLVLSSGSHTIPCDFGKAVQMLKRGGSAEDGIVRGQRCNQLQPIPNP